MTQPPSSTEILLHGTPTSGHAHRVLLLLRMLGLPHREVPAPAEIRRAAAFKALNPLHQVPVLVDGEVILSDSNAILVYLAKRYAPGSAWLPESPVEAALVQRFLSIAAGEIAFGPGLARVNTRWNTDQDTAPALAVAAKLLPFLDEHLAARNFLAADHPTIADLACYSYLAHAPEGGISLAPFPALRAWLRRVEALPHFVPMPAGPIPAQGAAA